MSQNWALDLQDSDSYSRGALQKHYENCNKYWEPYHPNHVPVASMQNIDMDSGLTGEDREVHDFFLHAMGANVVNHPKGRSAQMLTRVILHVLTVTRDRNVRLSEAAQYAQKHGITVPADELMDPDLNSSDVPDPGVLKLASEDYQRKFGRLPE
jgi:hypothetical protein